MTTAGCNNHWGCILALRDGKRIQFRNKDGKEWLDTPHPSFYPEWQYRIHPHGDKPLAPIIER